MKICIVNLNALPLISEAHKRMYVGGAEVQLLRLAVALKERGQNVSMLLYDEGQKEEAVFHGISTYKAFSRSAGFWGFRFFHPRVTGLLRAFSRANADAYIYSCAGMTLGLLGLYCWATQKRLVYRVASDADCNMKTALLRSLRDRLMYRFGISRADAILVQSEWQRRAIRENFGRESSVVSGLCDAIQVPELAKTKDIDALWLANIRYLKRPDRLFEVARKLKTVQFHIAGGAVPGEEVYYEEVKRLADSIPNVTFHGKVPFADVGKLFDRARVFVNTSEVEGFPNTFLQAWARGIPVATMFDPDSIVLTNGLGEFCESVDGLSRAIKSLLDNANEYQRASRAALRFMALRFDEEGSLRIYLAACGVNNFECVGRTYTQSSG